MVFWIEKVFENIYNCKKFKVYYCWHLDETQTHGSDDHVVLFECSNTVLAWVILYCDVIVQ